MVANSSMFSGSLRVDFAAPRLPISSCSLLRSSMICDVVWSIVVPDLIAVRSLNGVRVLWTAGSTTVHSSCCTWLGVTSGVFVVKSIHPDASVLDGFESLGEASGSLISS